MPGASKIRLSLARMRLDRLPVDGDDDGRVFFEVQCEDARVGGIDQAKSDTFAGAHAKGLGYPAVDRDGIADAACVREVVEISKVGMNGRVLLQAPIVQHPNDLAIDARRLRLLDDQCAIESAADLPGAVRVRVIPEGACVGAVEFIDEGVSRSDRTLREMRDAIHCVGEPDAMTMHRRFLGQAVFDDKAQSLSLGECGFPVPGTRLS
jgi:hypothetical protein